MNPERRTKNTAFSALCFVNDELRTGVDRFNTRRRRWLENLAMQFLARVVVPVNPRNVVRVIPPRFRGSFCTSDMLKADA